MQTIIHKPIHLNKVAPKFARMPCAWNDKSHEFMTPREVSRQVPWLSRGELTHRRNIGLAPSFEVISGCIMYRRDVIEAVVAETANAEDAPFLTYGWQ
jgi:hypothetical protein